MWTTASHVGRINVYFVVCNVEEIVVSLLSFDTCHLDEFSSLRHMIITASVFVSLSRVSNLYL